MRTIKNTLFSFLIFCFFFSNAQSKIKGNQQWLHYYNQLKLNEKWIIQAEAGFRWKEAFSQKTQYLIRASTKYALTPNFSLGGEYAKLGFYSQENIARLEFRPYQEFSLYQRISTFPINQRFRLEERFFNTIKNSNAQNSNTFAFRFRYSMMTRFTLCSLSKTKLDKKLLLNIGDEVFIQAGSDTNKTIFDQNRIIISPSFELNKNLSISLTYNNQYAAATEPKSHTYNNIIWAQVRHRIDLKKKKRVTTKI